MLPDGNKAEGMAENERTPMTMENVVFVLEVRKARVLH